MRKIFLILIASSITVCLSACGAPSDVRYKESDDVWMETQYAVYPERTSSVLVKWFNESTENLTGGESFALEKKTLGIWHPVVKLSDINYGFNLVGYPLPSGGTYWQEYNLIPYTDGLSSGTYRISSYVIEDYPQCIRAYGYFYVGKTAELRPVTRKDGTYEYVSPDYGFVLTLSSDWAGCTLDVIGSTGDTVLDTLAATFSNDWFALRIRHPNWSDNTQYQDIIFAVISDEDWNAANLKKAVGSNYELLPERVSTKKFTLMFSVNNMDNRLEGYDEALEALKTVTAIR